MTNSLYTTFKACLIIAMLLVYSICTAQYRPRYEFSFQNDNDLYLFNKQDQYYTNGIFFSFRRVVDSAGPDMSGANKIWGVTIGQKMYNAYTAHIRYIEEVDRPITAYLFLAANLDQYFPNETFLSFSGEIGTIGQRALGRQFQESIHRILNLYETAGWEYQLENAFGADVSARYGGLLYRNTGDWFDLSGQATATLGLNHTGLSLAPTMRFGRFNPFYQSAYTFSRLQSNKQAAVGNELFFYYSPQLNLVGYNATLQGGMFLHNKGPVTQTPARWVLYNQFGVMYANSALTLQFRYIVYSREVPGMFFRHRYGSIGAGYRF
ncbi:lipid A-modifier LpxR family protein [Parapedobacter deserti]|uniref:Lipid A-modifier LpxR family protein n=1 Tax=Parapedobacter deserti TaxID=1912957 RepID=A0ABV7JN46_9SPHI